MRCVVALTDVEHQRGLVDVAIALAGADELTLASVIEVPEDETLASAQTEARRQRRALRAVERPGVRVHVTVARRGWAAIAELVARERPDLLLVAWRRPGSEFLGTTIEDVLRDPPCDVAVVKGSFARAKRLLVPVRGGRYAQLAAAIAASFARARDGSVTLLHVESRSDHRHPSIYQLLGDRAFDERVD
ncbi:MAG: universal stress protein, partial [Candidatus Limnocylindria bacterium]